MKLKIINENNITKRIYLQDEIEQNISKIKNLSLDKNIYKSYLELNFYLEFDLIHFSRLIEYKLENFNHIKNNMNFSKEELLKRKRIYNKKKLLDNSLIIKENNIEFEYYRLIIFIREVNNIIFILDKTENIYIHSNLQMHKMMDKYYILEDLSNVKYFYLDNIKILLLEATNFQYNFSTIENIKDEDKILQLIRNEQLLKTVLHKNENKIEESDLIKTDLTIPEKKLFIITEQQKIKYKNWIKINMDKKRESIFFIMIILMYLEKRNCLIKNLSINNFFIREKETILNYKIEEYEYKINTKFELYLDLHENNEIELKSEKFSYNLNFLRSNIRIFEDIYETFHYNFYKYRFLRKFKIKDEKELSVIPFQNYLYMLNIFNIIYILNENNYIPYIILKKKDNILFLKNFNDEELEFNLESKQKLYFVYNKYFNADIII